MGVCPCGREEHARIEDLKGGYDVWSRECNEVRGGWWERPTMSWALGLSGCSMWTWGQMPWVIKSPSVCYTPMWSCKGPYYCQITTRRLPTILGWCIPLSSRNSQDKFHSKVSPYLCDSPHLFSISSQLIQHSLALIPSHSFVSSWTSFWNW